MSDPSKETIDSLLESPDKGVGKAQGAISKLWRRILFDLNITGNRWNAMMLRYINDPANGVKDDAKRKSWTRGNLNTELIGTDMTFYSLEKGIRLLKMSRITLVLIGEWPSGHKTTHRISAVLEDNSRMSIDEDLQEATIIRSDEEIITALVDVHRNNPKRLAYIKEQVAERIRSKK